jgi:hypothetical protein
MIDTDKMLEITQEIYENALDSFIKNEVDYTLGIALLAGAVALLITNHNGEITDEDAAKLFLSRFSASLAQITDVHVVEVPNKIRFDYENN